jgi:hypothetical protein
MSRRRPVVLVAVTMLVVSVLTFSFVAEAKPSGGNNKLNAKACQGTGYQSLYRQDGTGFTNADECASYAAQGGVLATATPGATATPTPTNTPTPIPLSSGCTAIAAEGTFQRQDALWFGIPLLAGERLTLNATNLEGTTTAVWLDVNNVTAATSTGDFPVFLFYDISADGTYIVRFYVESFLQGNTALMDVGCVRP